MAINTTTRFYLSLDKILSPRTDVLLTQRVVARFGTGQSISASTLATMPVGTTPGTKSVIAVADALNQLAEVNEANSKFVAVMVRLRRRPRPKVVSPGNAAGSNPARCPASTCIARLVS